LRRTLVLGKSQSPLLAIIATRQTIVALLQAPIIVLETPILRVLAVPQIIRQQKRATKPAAITLIASDSFSPPLMEASAQGLVADLSNV